MTPSSEKTNSRKVLYSSGVKSKLYGSGQTQTPSVYRSFVGFMIVSPVFLSTGYAASPASIFASSSVSGSV